MIAAISVPVTTTETTLIAGMTDARYRERDGNLLPAHNPPSAVPIAIPSDPLTASGPTMSPAPTGTTVKATTNVKTRGHPRTPGEGAGRTARTRGGGRARGEARPKPSEEGNGQCRRC